LRGLQIWSGKKEEKCLARIKEVDQLSILSIIQGKGGEMTAASRVKLVKVGE